ncbi:hypothetical protein EDC96DRAFT_108362 [Choanephora cucurbitarum]|nr:hypothetical protein EDC96DRAFT_108362 [Choanephora cucurbitarum]
MISTKECLQPPPSPTLSATSSISSWFQKSPSELIPMLKNAYTTIRDKDKDLRLAAEIGKSLLENNIVLKSNYDDLLSQSVYPTPSSSYTLSDREDIIFLPTHTTREAKIEILEKANTDLSAQLELTVQHQQKKEKLHKRKEHEMETEIYLLKASLDHATIQLQQMKEKTLSKEGNPKQSVLPEDNELLHEKIKELKLENDQVYHSKLAVEEKLMKTLHDLRLLKQKVDQFQFTLHDHEQLQKSFEAQQLHIQQLKSSLEEHRQLLSQLRDHEIMYKEEQQNQNLLSELHHAWSRKDQDDDDDEEENDKLLASILLKAGVVERDAIDDALSLIGRLENEYDHQRYLKENGHINKEESFLETEKAHTMLIKSDKQLANVTHSPSTCPPSPGLVGTLQRMMKRILYFTWRWFRFTLIMTIAVFLSLKEGPPSSVKYPRRLA